MTGPESIESLRRLGLQRREANLPQLLSALEHPDASHRALAARAISWLRLPRLGHHLYPFVEDADQDVRSAIAAGFAILGDRSAGPPLLHALTSDPSPTVRSAAARSLGWLRLETGAPALMAGLTTDEDADTRAESARALGRLRWLQAMDALLSALSDSSPRVRQSAVSALGAIFGRPGDEEAADETVLTTLRGRLTDPDAETRALTLRALTACGAPDGFERCLGGLTDPNPGVRVTAAVSLRHLGETAALPYLQTRADDPHREAEEQIRRTILVLEGLRSPVDDEDGGN